MRSYMRSSITALGIILILFLSCGVSWSQVSSSGELLPYDLVMEEGFEPGLGSPVGSVLLVEGEVVLMHAGSVTGYLAEEDLPLYKGDTIVTKARSRIRLSLKGESTVTLSSNTKLELNESVYDRKKRSRFSFLRMTVGKARFVVRKMMELRRSEFKVKTTTAVVGVRGSDFIIIAELDRTEVTALEDTELEVVSLVEPGAAPTILEDYQQTLIEEGSLPTDPVAVSEEDAEDMIQEFIFPIDGLEPEAGADEEVRRTAPGVILEPSAAAYEGAVFVSEDELVEPAVQITEEIEDFEEPDVMDEVEVFDDMEAVEADQEQIDEILTEEEAIQELPGFPEMPE